MTERNDPLAPITSLIEAVQEWEVVTVRRLYDGGQIKLRFPNGYGASIIRHHGSYGSEEGLFEVGVLDRDGELAYDTPIADDVVGHLDSDGVHALLRRIAALPAASTASPQTCEDRGYSCCEGPSRLAPENCITHHAAE